MRVHTFFKEHLLHRHDGDVVIDRITLGVSKLVPASALSHRFAHGFVFLAHTDFCGYLDLLGTSARHCSLAIHPSYHNYQFPGEPYGFVLLCAYMNPVFTGYGLIKAHNSISPQKSNAH